MSGLTNRGCDFEEYWVFDSIKSVREERKASTTASSKKWENGLIIWMA